MTHLSRLAFAVSSQSERWDGPMSCDLMQHMSGSARLGRSDRRVSCKAEAMHDEVRLAAFEADSAVASDDLSSWRNVL